MPIATAEIYAEMISRAKAGGFAYPAINVTSSQTLNAALRGFSDAGSDGIVQVSTGGAEYLSGSTIKDMASGSLAFAAFAHEVAKKYPVNIALHTDHCPKDKLDGFVRPLLAASQERVARGGEPLFQSHMWDGSAVPLAENLARASELLAEAAAAKVILEVEVGVVGGEEDGIVGAIDEKLYSTAEDAPEILKEIQDAVGVKYGVEKPFNLVFHGGSGSLLEEIRSAVDYGVIKMNIDTDTQYAFTRPVAEHMFRNFDGVLKVDGEVGNKKAYDPRTWGKLAEESMAKRVVRACEDLRSAGTQLP
jgi:fructose-bisphosphate aldolase class II